MHDFLLVRRCNHSSILYRFRVIWRWIILWPWNLGYRSLKVIETGAIQKPGCLFLFAFHSEYGAVLYRLRDIASYIGWKSEFLYPTCIYRPAAAGGDPAGILWRCLMLIKLEWLGYRMMKNYDNMLSRFHLIPEHHGRTDRQTDWRTRDKNENLLFSRDAMHNAAYAVVRCPSVRHVRIFHWKE